jgi:transcription-repair coupling factor (superfamily II helicase)
VCLVVSGAVGALPGLILAVLAAERPVLAVLPDESAGERLAADIAAAGGEGVWIAPEPALTPYQNVAPSLKSKRNEFALLSALSDSSCRAALVPARFLSLRLPAPEDFRRRLLRLETGRPLLREDLVSYLAREGYSRCDLVIETGDFAVRGALVDVFPPDTKRPWRIEFDGDEVASLRSFDPDTQRSSATVERLALPPFSAVARSDPEEERLSARLGRVPTDAQRALFAAAASGASATIFDHARESLVVIVDPAGVAEALSQWEARVVADYDPGRDSIAPSELLHRAETLEATLASRGALVFDRLGLWPGVPVAIAAEEVPSFDGNVREAAGEIARSLEAGFQVTVAVSPRGGTEKVRRFLHEYGLADAETAPGRLSAGFRLRRPRHVVYAEEQIFGPERSYRPARRKMSEAFLSDLRDLKPGEFVVHADYGVARFRGLKRIPVEGSEREMVELVYADEKALLLPVERLDRVQKYSAAEGIEPKVDRLGGAGWARKTQAARKAVRDLSEELLKLYARRAQAGGFTFSKDSEWQKEFEDAFEHVETPDQHQAIAEVKRDMERPAPMDRLLCGDVGYGKTEVAMRAAFKAVLDGKQVALMAPTTILADQHQRTFRRRFAAFPVTIELLSRFRDRAEQKAVLEKVADGGVDILIATHRMLSKDIRFRDLGLLIVDEEQRFGVAQKERVKQWKTSVDILSMSATPIPRSLNLSLSGIRDLSIIETPPRDRLAIETQILPKNGDVVAEAIRFELDRGGQVFYVHNRVESIGAEKQFLEELLPGARIAVGHGQMGEGELERTMMDFVARRHDILLATSIVENGLDIPSVNTILIDRADTFGLSQLYQLRGRVGRSDKAAYCYLLVDSQAALSETARRRLATIREFCDLGAGFRIAAKDLEIRGSGNFLGAEQSGHIAAVGFEMYLDLLEEAIRELKGEAAPVERTATISLGADVTIPASYLPDESLRLSLYKRVARAHDDAEVREIARETEDRFGPPPGALWHLIEYSRLRRRAERFGLRIIERRGPLIRLVFAEDSAPEAAAVAAFARATPGAVWAGGAVTIPGAISLSRLVDLLDEFPLRRTA